jgi:hypothetical protein
MNKQESERRGELEPSETAAVKDNPHGPNNYQIIIAVLVLALTVTGLFFLQETNSLRVQNNQLLSHSSGRDEQFANIDKILTLQKTEVFANRTVVTWPGVDPTVPIHHEDCTCFQYSGYLAVSWTTTVARVRFRLIQFALNLDTPYGYIGSYRLPVSSADIAHMEFRLEYCPSSGCGQLTYTLVYHY